MFIVQTAKVQAVWVQRWATGKLLPTTTVLSLKNDNLYFLVQTECSSIRFLLLQRLFNTNAGRFFNQLVHVTEICEI